MAEVAGGGAVQVMAIMRDPISEAPTSALIDEEDEIAAVLAVAEATAAADGAGAVPSAVSSAVDELVLFPASHHVLPESERDQKIALEYQGFYNTLIADRRAYTERLRNFELGPYLETKIDGGPVTNILLDFTTANRMKRCAPPGELGGDAL